MASDDVSSPFEDRGPDANGLSQPGPLTIPFTRLWSRGWYFFPPPSLCTDLLDGFVSSLPLLFLTKRVSITRTRSLSLALFASHDHTRHYNAHVCALSHPPSLWLSSVPVVTYCCLISSVSFSLLWSCVSDRSWVIIRVFGTSSVRSSNLFFLSVFPTVSVLDEKQLKKSCINV